MTLHQDLISSAIREANPNLLKSITFYWAQGVIDLYIEYKPPKMHIWRRIMGFLGYIDNLIGVNFQDRHLIIISGRANRRSLGKERLIDMGSMGMRWGTEIRRYDYDLAQPDSLLRIGKQISRLFTGK